ncbi:MAG: phosphoserine phosphatase SerB [Inquilinaceae bacterium]
MDHVLTLTADPAKRGLDDSMTEAAAAALAATGATVAPRDRLAAGIACDIAFAGVDLAIGLAAARAALAEAPVDINAGPARDRRKALLIADMDSTIVVGETLDELASLAGVGDRVAPITARAMNGEIGFEAALRERVALLAGQPASLVDRVRAGLTLMPGAPSLIATMARAGAHTHLVSGGFTVFTDAVASMVGFAAASGNRLTVVDGYLTGTVAEPILGRDQKLATLREAAAARGLTPMDAVAVGDGANDLAMIQAAGLGVAFRAKPSVRAAAAVSIDHGDLTALLYLQGYRDEEILSGSTLAV